MKKVIYIKYSNERSEKYRIKTSILENEKGIRSVEKMPLTEAAREHVFNIEKNYKLLSEYYKDEKVCVNKCILQQDRIELEYLAGKTFEEELDILLAEKRYDEIKEKIQEYIQVICNVKDVREFKVTEEFKKVFGEINLPIGLRATGLSNIDMIFSNIIIDDKWHIIDYEWTFNFPVPLNYIVYRAVLGYVYSTPARTVLNNIMPIDKLLDITSEQINAYEKMNVGFNLYVWGKQRGISESYEKMIQPVTPIQEVISYKEKYDYENEIQVFYDCGQGMSEGNSLRFKPKVDESGEITFRVPIKNDTIQAIRIDPSNSYCIVDIKKISNQEFYTNGIGIGENSILFLTDDPQIILNDIKAEDIFIEVGLKVQILSAEIAGIIGKTILEHQKLMEQMGDKINQIEVSRDGLMKVNSELQSNNKELRQGNKELQQVNESLKQVNEKIQQVNDNLKDEKNYLQKEKSNLENAQKVMLSELEERQKVVEAQHTEIQANTKYIDELQKDNQAKEALIKEMESTKIWRAYRVYRKMRGDK